MGQTEGKLSQPAGADAAQDSSSSTPSSSIPSSNNFSTHPSEKTETEKEEEEGEGKDEDTQEDEAQTGEETNNNNNNNNDNNNILKKSTELKDGFSKLGANIISTAKGKVPYTSYSVSALGKKAASAVEDAIVTVKAGIIKTEEEPELIALAKMPLFLPIIKSSVPLTDLAKGVSLRKTTIEYLDPQIIISSLMAYQRYVVLTAKMIGARQTEVINKIKDAEMATGRKAVFTLAINVTDMRHFNTQFSEIGRFQSNLERTKDTIKDIIGMMERLNATLPPDDQLEPLQLSSSSSSSSLLYSPSSDPKI